VYEIFSIERRF